MPRPVLVEGKGGGAIRDSQCPRGGHGTNHVEGEQRQQLPYPGRH